MANLTLRPFITGSHAYGIPNTKSDIDLMIYVTHADFNKLLNTADKMDHPEDENYLAEGGISLLFGNLNLICCRREAEYKVCRKGTRELKKKAHVPREFAVEYFHQLRVEAGLIRK